MKKSVLIFTAFIMLFSLTTNAQNNNTTKNNYVVLTKKIPQLQPILITAEELKKEDGHHFGDFQVIVCGQTVTGLTEKKEMQKYLDRAKKAGVSIKACGFSLKKFGVNPEEIPSTMEVVDNGILYDFQLQKKGYFSIEL
ncbi:MULTISPECIES: DsrE family protein [Salegentibacter]|jgi:intracellular sulfur oxidation DsrE/DsrF family protein|uniref:Intracellular sulfur oxidation protein, DsrE/DsrF family n=1 Tax=Salegentibacter agarivorans TaxID=345907 RepID=A0A1I2K517_9FLAO|nr:MULTISPECIES: DsrE family protein [Salegentibacter]APS39464.1 sulfur reduction protein DsrE [Salegentibacter sp. T436]SFF62285.1 Intracellular sulfur oxidation protein, DsrE/DsrF family [Salegentibacter agarivorans]